MCDYEEFNYICGHQKTRLLTYCHFARVDHLHQCFVVKVIKGTHQKDFACDPCNHAHAYCEGKSGASGATSPTRPPQPSRSPQPPRPRSSPPLIQQTYNDNTPSIEEYTIKTCTTILKTSFITATDHGLWTAITLAARVCFLSNLLGVELPHVEFPSNFYYLRYCKEKTKRGKKAGRTKAYAQKVLSCFVLDYFLSSLLERWALSVAFLIVAFLDVKFLLSKIFVERACG